MLFGGGLRAVDAVADRDDHVEVVVADLARNLATSLGSNHPAFPVGCLLAQLPRASRLEDALKEEFLR